MTEVAQGAPAWVRLDGPVLFVGGQLDADAVLAIRGEGERLIAAGGSELLVDLDQVVGADSTTLSLLLCWQRAALAQSKSLRFRNVGEQLLSLAALSGLHRQLPGFDAGDRS